MTYVTMIAMLALIEYFYFSLEVGRARARYGIEAPAISGDPGFERIYRVHQNTLEQLVIFLPSLYASGYFVSEIYAVAAGVVFLVGRAMYFRGYSAAAEKRGAGMAVTGIANLALLLGGLVGALIASF
jgi:glutathione S-transferase